MRWGQLPNTIIKLSSIPPQDKFPHRDITPVIKRLVAEYSPDRMIYGGGFNADATGNSYRAAFKRARGYIAYLSAAEQAKILGKNAVRLLALKGSSCPPGVISSFLTEFFPFSYTPCLLSTPTVQHTDSLMPVAPSLIDRLANHC